MLLRYRNISTKSIISITRELLFADICLRWEGRSIRQVWKLKKGNVKGEMMQWEISRKKRKKLSLRMRKKLKKKSQWSKGQELHKPSISWSTQEISYFWMKPYFQSNNYQTTSTTILLSGSIKAKLVTTFASQQLLLFTTIKFFSPKSREDFSQGRSTSIKLTSLEPNSTRWPMPTQKNEKSLPQMSIRSTMTIFLRK